MHLLLSVKRYSSSVDSTSSHALFRRGSEKAFNEDIGISSLLLPYSNFGNFFIMERQAYHLLREVGNVPLLQNRGTHLYNKIGKTDQAEARGSIALLVSIRLA